jgi:uncharacterized protein (TIGR02001 family)
MKHTSITLLTLTAAAGFAQSTAAAPSAFTTSGNLSLTSDYVFRGVSQSEGQLAVQGGFDVAHKSGLSAGVWASSVSSAKGSLEVDLYANYGFKLGAVDLSVGYINYMYNTSVNGGNGGEANVALSVAGVTLKASKGVSGSLSDYYYEANYSREIAKSLTLGLHYGYDRANKDSDYSVGLTYPILGLDTTVAYSKLDSKGSITAFTVKKTF